jgi:hypothetical protein
MSVWLAFVLDTSPSTFSWVQILGLIGISVLTVLPIRTDIADFLAYRPSFIGIISRCDPFPYQRPKDEVLWRSISSKVGNFFAKVSRTNFPASAATYGEYFWKPNHSSTKSAVLGHLPRSCVHKSLFGYQSVSSAIPCKKCCNNGLSGHPHLGLCCDKFLASVLL